MSDKTEIIGQRAVQTNFPETFEPTREWYTAFVSELNRVLSQIQTDFWVAAASGGAVTTQIRFNNGIRVPLTYTQPSNLPTNPFLAPPTDDSNPAYSDSVRDPKKIP